MSVITYRDLVRIRTQYNYSDRTSTFSNWIYDERKQTIDGLQYRSVLTPMDREVRVRDHSGETRSMLMFGSNNYLGLATHPLVVKRVQEAVATVGVGVGGPPALNGHGPLHRELEERLAAIEGKESALLYGSGYAANLGLMSALPSSSDFALYDAHSHASFIDGMKLGRVPGKTFPHNDTKALDQMLGEVRDEYRDVFVSVEGVYSMSGDVARLDRITEVCKRHGAVLIVDDAHGTGVTGPGGHGTVAMFDVAPDVDLVVGTFSKAFSVSGGFIAADREVVDYLRYFSRSYVFSASPSPAVCAAVLAGLEVLKTEPERHARLLDNAATLARGLQARGFAANGLTPIFSLPTPAGVDVRGMAHAFNRRGIFVNHIEAPVVPVTEQRFRLSVSAQHTPEDLAQLLTVIDEVWAEYVEGIDTAADAVCDDTPMIDAFEGGF